MPRAVNAVVPSTVAAAIGAIFRSGVERVIVVLVMTTSCGWW